MSAAVRQGAALRVAIAGAALLCCIAALGCSSERVVNPTLAVVRLEASDGVKQATVRLDISVAGGTGSAAEPDLSRNARTESLDQGFPWSVMVEPKGGDHTRIYELVARAFDAGGSELARATLVSGFRRHEIVTHTLVLASECIQGDTSPLCVTVLEASDADRYETEPVAPPEPSTPEAGNSDGSDPDGTGVDEGSGSTNPLDPDPLEAEPADPSRCAQFSVDPTATGEGFGCFIQNFGFGSCVALVGNWTTVQATARCDALDEAGAGCLMKNVFCDRDHVSDGASSGTDGLSACIDWDVEDESGDPQIGKHQINYGGTPEVICLGVLGSDQWQPRGDGWSEQILPWAPETGTQDRDPDPDPPGSGVLTGEQPECLAAFGRLSRCYLERDMCDAAASARIDDFGYILSTVNCPALNDMGISPEALAMYLNAETPCDAPDIVDFTEQFDMGPLADLCTAPAMTDGDCRAACDHIVPCAGQFTNASSQTELSSEASCRANCMEDPFNVLAYPCTSESSGCDAVVACFEDSGYMP